MLGDETETVRKSAAVALGRIADSRAVTSLIKALDDAHYSVRMSSVRALTAIGDPACDSLTESIDRMSDIASFLAYEIWAACEYRPARKFLEEATKSEDKFRRGFAILAFASVDPGKAEKRMRKMLKSETDLFVLSRIHAAQELLESTTD
jgi:HEAT repeat protein